MRRPADGFPESRRTSLGWQGIAPTRLHADRVSPRYRAPTATEFDN